MDTRPLDTDFLTEDLMEKALDLTDSSFAELLYQMTLTQDEQDPDTPGFLNSVGEIFWQRYMAGYDTSDLERAISSYDKSVRLTEDFDADQPPRLMDLGLALWTRFEDTGDMSDIDAACSCFERSLLNEPPGMRACHQMGYLGGALVERAKHSGDVSDLTRAITSLLKALDNAPEGDPGQADYLINLGSALIMRFDCLGEPPDLAAAISANQKAVDLTPDGHPEQPRRLNSLGGALEKRFDRFGQLSDLEASVAVKRNTVGLTADGHPDKATYLNNLCAALQTRFERLGDLSDLEEAISAQRNAVNLFTNGRLNEALYLNNLGTALQTRFERLGDLSDLEAAISAERRAVDLTPDDHPSKLRRLSNLATALETRFERIEDVSDLEAAISAKQTVVGLTSDNQPDKPRYLNDLGNVLEKRFERLGQLSDLEAAVDAKRNAVDLTPDGHRSKPGRLNDLANVLETRFECLGDLPDLEAAISSLRIAVDLTPDGHPSKAGRWNNLGHALEKRFGHLGQLPDLEEAIGAKKNAVGLVPDNHPDKAIYLNNLGSALQIRFDSIGNVSDKDAAMDAVSTAAESIAGSPHIKLKAARRWCKWSALANDRQNTLRAYGCAISLIQRVAWMGLAIEGRHWQLEKVGELVRDAAAAAVRYGEYGTALEWLEQGRSVVWGQTLHRRSPLDLLQVRDCIRAARLTEISRALEGNAVEEGSMAEAIHDQLRTLSIEWDQLIDEVREMEGFEDFLGPKKVAQLLPVAFTYPIVVLNTHETGCDALVLRAEADVVVHIPLSLTFHRAQALLSTLETIKSRHSRGRNAELVDRGFRFVGSESYDPDKMIMSLLAELWSGVVKPVLEALAISPPDSSNADLPRICWCPTGPLAFLPIHAAGMYDTDEPGAKVFNFVVSSYTPSVAALLQAPAPSPNRPKILAVAQAEQANKHFSALPKTREEIQLLKQRAAASSVDLVVAEDKFGTVQHVLEAIKECHWVHLACHGIQDLDSPTKSAFILADGNLELREIIKHPLPHAEFAFLSACQTATGEINLSEEAVHLAAGMMLAGYRSIIATMWSILDKDGPVVADAVYAEMLKDGKADYTRAAYALHLAVQKLRLSGAPLLAWMPFIHMGA